MKSRFARWSRHPSQSKRGSLTILLLVCLLAVTTLVIASVSTGIRYRQQTRIELQIEQTKWLLDAGIGKAIDLLTGDADFGEHEIVIEEQLENYVGRLDFKRIDRAGQELACRVTATLNSRHDQSVVTRRSREFVLTRDLENKRNRKNNPG